MLHPLLLLRALSMSICMSLLGQLQLDADVDGVSMPGAACGAAFVYALPAGELLEAPCCRSLTCTNWGAGGWLSCFTILGTIRIPSTPSCMSTRDHCVARLGQYLPGCLSL